MERRKKGGQAPQNLIEGFNAYLDSTWRENPTLIRQFLELRPDYEQLCAEVAYIFQKRLKDLQIEISTITWRAKTLDSFLEKIRRKKYNDPFQEISDFAGVRVVYLYKQDADRIEEIIRHEFDVLEKVDKLEEMGADRFGYLATHFIARLGQQSSGARYEDLKRLVFEIQVRTVLQDAWAIVDHHLAYKHESDVPKHLQRQLTSIAGLFENVDEQFNAIYQKINEYVADLEKSSKSDSKDFLENRLDLESFKAYLSWKFKKSSADKLVSDQIERVFNLIDKDKYKTLSQLDKSIGLTTEDIAEIKRWALKEVEANEKPPDPPGIFLFRVALSLTDANFRRMNTFTNPIWHKFIEERVSKRA